MYTPDKRALAIVRVLLSLFTAALVSATAYFCAWQEYRGYHYFVEEQHTTRRTLNELGAEIERHRNTTGTLPKALTELNIAEERKVTVDDKGQPMDGWRRPFQYRANGADYVLFSTGRDGLPGGSGLDADLFLGKKDPASELPTLWQFATDLDTGGIKLGCLLAGVFAFPICLFASFRAVSKKSIVTAVISFLVTAGFAIVAAVVIGVLHLPSGH